MRRYTPPAPIHFYSKLLDRYFKNDVNGFSSTSDFYFMHARNYVGGFRRTQKKSQKDLITSQGSDAKGDGWLNW